METFLNPMLRKILETLIRDGLKALGVTLVARELVNEADVVALIPGLTAFLVGLIWSLWERRSSLRKVHTALALPEGTTHQELVATMKRDGCVPASLPPTVKPIAPAEFAIFGSSKR